MQGWVGDTSEYRGMEGGIGEILHVERKAVKVGLCEGGSESALPGQTNGSGSLSPAVHGFNYP